VKHFIAPITEPEEKPEKSYGTFAPGELVGPGFICWECERPGNRWQGYCAWCADWHLP
jgi:hypothetical protein